jgi:hypothetical protein
MAKSAHELYDQMVRVIDKAAADHNIFDVPKAAEAAGMTGGEVKSGGFSQHWDYSYTDERGDKLDVNCYWRDKSKPFSIQPDHHVMSAHLSGSQKASHTNTYDE